MRRGNEPINFTLLLVSTVLVLMVAIVITIGIKNALYLDQEDSVCAKQIMAHATASKFTRGEAAPTINCPTKELSVNGEQEEVNEYLAKELKRCWGQWGRGQYALFGRENGTYCHVCSVVEVSGVAQVQGLPQYLDTHKATKDLTYSQYLTGTKTGEYFQNEGTKAVSAISMPTDKPLAVVFYHAKGRTQLQAIRDMIFGSPAQGAAMGAAAGGTAAGAALFGVGVVAGVVGAPVVIGGFVASTVMLAALSAGAAGGLWVSIEGRTEFDTMSAVVIRPLDRNNISAIGCVYAPVTNTQGI
jgi:hypothetical protein